MAKVTFVCYRVYSETQVAYLVLAGAVPHGRYLPRDLPEYDEGNALCSCCGRLFDATVGPCCSEWRPLSEYNVTVGSFVHAACVALCCDAKNPM